MFNLEKRERLIILALIILFSSGLIFGLYKRSHPVIDVKLKAFDYSKSAEGIGKININEADEALLAALPSVGKALAGRIIAYRNENGDFRSIEEVKKVKGIKDKFFEKIKDSITVE